MNKKKEIYNKFYAKSNELSFGEIATPELKEFIKFIPDNSNVMDIASGDGRDTVFFLRNNMEVTALDYSIVALQKLRKKASKLDLAKKLKTIEANLVDWKYPENQFDFINCVTGLDHIKIEDVDSVVEKCIRSLKSKGFLFFQVHTTDDPGYNIEKGNKVSELAPMILTYYPPNSLLKLVLPKGVRILKYEERTEDDFDHGEPHKHGFAILFAQKS